MIALASYHLEHGWLGPAGVVDDLVVTVEDGRFTYVGTDPVPGAEPVPGLTLPGLANVHSHAFHRALRGRGQRGRGSFWTWREQMYDVAGRLDPDSYRVLATAAFREMLAAGFTTVGEFHYLHHRPDGSPYDDGNAMGLALVEAARAAGLRIALLDTCYLSAGFGAPVEGVQRRFCDGTAEQWLHRADELAGTVADAAGGVVVGAAVHSVRAVPLDGIRLVAEWADRFETPLHVHLSEQVAENEQCLAAYGRTPTEVLAEAGALGDRTTVVHATHLTATDVVRLGATATTACLCPTTERDLGDGIGPGRELADAGARIVLGTDSHAVVDGFEEARGLEMHERLRTRQRGHWPAGELLRAATGDGHAAVGFPDAGHLAVGQRADLVVVDLTSPRTAGCGAAPETAVFAATAADVVRVMVDGRWVHQRDDAPEIAAALDAAVRGVWEEA